MGALHTCFTCKEMEIHLHWSLEWMPALHCTAAIWRLHSPWHLLLPASFGLQLELRFLSCKATGFTQRDWHDCVLTLSFLRLTISLYFSNRLINSDMLLEKTLSAYLHVRNIQPAFWMVLFLFCRSGKGTADPLTHSGKRTRIKLVWPK